MVNISPKPLSASQAQTYHKLEYTSASQSYYKQGDEVQGEWQGKLAEEFGLTGVVNAEHFTRLTEGQHPQTGDQMVKHRTSTEYTNAEGSSVKPVEHRAGWDATFSPPKSVSLTALVGGDDRVREAHGAAVTFALNELEKYTQARIGGNNAAETTGKFIAAKFEHDTARPVDGYAAPQLHTHVVIFNVTEREDGSTRALQSKSLYDSQNYATAVYQSHLTYQLRNLGYEIEAGKSGAPEIKGYSQEYMEASSLRSQVIREQMEKSGRNGPEAAQIAAHNTREQKQELSPAEVLASHKALAAEYGNQAEKVISEARARVERQERKPEDLLGKAREAVTYSRSSNFEREAVIDERTLMRDALRRGMGETTFDHVRAEFDARQKQGDLRQIKGEKHDTGRSFTTPETIANERANVAHVMRGQDTVQPILQQEQAAQQAASRAIFNPAQRRVIEEVLTSQDRIHGIQGLAGTGKTTVLSSVREGAERSGFIVQGFAPTNRAAGALRDAGIEATTLQSFLTKGDSSGTAAANPASPHLYMLDESSLASTKQMRDFLDKIKPQDRVLLIGDTRQHQGVDAGRPFEQMQDAGMKTSRLDQIVRQRNSPELLKAVEHLSKGETVEGIRMLREQGRVTELPDSKERIQAIAKDYVSNPEKTIVISPDNKSRQLINQAIRGEMQAGGSLGDDGQEFRSLIHRSDMTGADREWAARYQPGDVLKYTKGSKAYGVERDSLSVVTSSSARDNTITVTRQDGQSVSYDPRRLSGVNVYREEPREFATGDRLQFTATDKDLNVANRDLGTITKIEPGQLTVRMDGKEDRTVSFDPAQMRHIDHGYAVTSHVSQGLTEGRVIVNIDTDSSRNLINTRLAYVTISRAETDARIYTNDAETLGARLATDVSKTAAVDFRQPVAAPRRSTVEPEVHQYSDPNHRIAAVATAYMQRPDSSVIVAPDRAERQELNQLIRADLQAQGTLSPDSKSLTVYVEQPITNPKLAAQYTPGDLIQYGQGSPELHGINHNSVGTVLASDPQKNALTVQTSTGDWATYSPHLTKTMTAESAVYRVEQREIAQGERIQITSSVAELGIRKGEFGTVTAISESRELDVQLDKGETVHLNQRQAQHIEHGYAVESIRAGAPERIIVTQEAALESQREIASLTRSGREVSVYTSDGSSPAQALKNPISLPQQQQIDATANVIAQDNALTSPNVVAPEATQVQHRRGMGI